MMNKIEKYLEADQIAVDMHENQGGWKQAIRETKK